MSSFRSHFRNQQQQNDSLADSQKSRQASRIPTMQSSSESGKQSKVSQQVSRLAKRSSRIINGPPAPTPSMRNAVMPDNTASVAMSSSASNRHSMLPPPTTIRTPSLISGSSVSTFDSPRSSALRRKPSSAIDRHTAHKYADQSSIDIGRFAMHSRSDTYSDDLDDSVLGIVPSMTTYGETSAHYHGVDDLGAIVSDEPAGVSFNVTPPVPMYAPSITPSTRYTDSPFSHAPTPSSVSSYSSGIVATSNYSPNPRLPSPSKSRPASNTRSSSRDDSSRLAPVRESSTSSSNKTIRPKDTKDKESPSRPGMSRKASSSVTSPTKSSELRSQPSRNRLTKEQHSSTSAKKPVQIPPELAHLNVDVASKSVPRHAPPARPSREGMPNLADVKAPSHIVQSDLPRLYTSYHKRTPSQDTPVSSSSPSLKTRLGLSSKSSSRNESPRVDSAVSASALTRTYTGGSTSDSAQTDDNRLTRKDSPAVARGTSPAKSQRFGFFSRKSKSEGAKVLEKPKRQPTKGPAAGTGHEGYGRFGLRGRSGSVSSSSVGFRSPSADSETSTVPQVQPSRKTSMASKDSADLDDFLRERLNPVILRGSGTGSTISTSTFGSDLPGTSLKYVSSNVSPRDSYTTPHLLPSAMHKTSGASPRPTVDRRMSSDISDDDAGLPYPSMATRRSSTRISQVSNASSSQSRLPTHQFRRLPQKSSSVDSYNDGHSVSSYTESPMLINDTAAHDKEGLWLRSGPPEQPRKPSRKFPFFQRAHSSPRAQTRANAEAISPEPIPFQQEAPSRAVAQYGMLEFIEPVGLDEIERMVHESETSVEDSQSDANGPAKIVPYEKRHQSLLPAPPRPAYANHLNLAAQLTPPEIQVDRQPLDKPLEKSNQNMVRTPEIPHMSTPEPKVLLNTPEQSNSNNSPRQPRLSPVGRIPRVVSKRDRDRKLSDNSFSRPFAQTQPRPSVKPPGSVYTQIREMASPIESNSQPESSTSARSDTNAADRRSGTFTSLPSSSTARTSMEMPLHSEFLRFASRKGSDLSYSSGSDAQSWYATAYAQPFQQDDIWNEYNDLMDEVMPMKTPTTGSSLGAPFQYSSMLYDPNNLPYSLPPLTSAPPSTELPLPPGTTLVPVVLSVPQQIARFLQPSLSPLLSDNLSTFSSGYGDRNSGTIYSQNRAILQGPSRSGIPQPRRPSAGSTRRASVASSRNSRSSVHSRSSSLPEVSARNSTASIPAVSQSKETRLKDIAEIAKVDQVSLRYGALMTSKWLSFGRVLFSPAHNEMQLAEDPRILIVDGLGSDWSYYVAMSYKSAGVYNLCPDTLGSSVANWPDPTTKPPRNHFQIPFSGIASPIPFPKGFFNAVVFRFPVAAPEEAYQFFISECKRVLRPGGFLEVAVLDLDLMNMGNKARKAVRDLKTRIQQRDRNICLSNLSDVLIRLIGRRGFDDVQRCIVGVPAVGRIPRSQDISSIGSGEDDRHAKPSVEVPFAEQQFSFAELLDDKLTRQFSPNDESITKMVAKVGRWWYSTCYEQASPTHGQIGVWNDRMLRRECEKQGTSFRLLICHAQKPTQTRRRTVSV